MDTDIDTEALRRIHDVLPPSPRVDARDVYTQTSNVSRALSELRRSEQELQNWLGREEPAQEEAREQAQERELPHEHASAVPRPLTIPRTPGFTSIGDVLARGAVFYTAPARRVSAVRAHVLLTGQMLWFHPLDESGHAEVDVAKVQQVPWLAPLDLRAHSVLLTTVPSDRITFTPRLPECMHNECIYLRATRRDEPQTSDAFSSMTAMKTRCCYLIPENQSVFRDWEAGLLDVLVRRGGMNGL